ncbi:MAG: PilZ domain-containing protein [PVC group bacterium]|nr:PilZ domain-containing protein [PVC group bacterium]
MDGSYDGAENRRSKRVAVNFIVTYKPDGAMIAHMRIGSKLRIIALMVNLSAKGMAIATEYDIPVETVLVIKFTLVNLNTKSDEQVRSMEILGQVRYNVVWKEMGHRIGIAFTKISNEDKRAITGFVEAAIKEKQE